MSALRLGARDQVEGVDHFKIQGDYRSYYKGHMDKIKGEGGGGEGHRSVSFQSFGVTLVGASPLGMDSLGA